MHIVTRLPRRQRLQRRMYLPYERETVNGEGLGGLEGLKFKKAFKRLIKVKKSSFKLKNIMGAVGSGTMFAVTGGLSTLAPKATGAHSKLARIVGIGTTAVAAVVGGAVLLPAGAIAGAGSALTSIGSGITGTVMKGGMGLLSMFGGGGKGIAPQQSGYPEGYGPYSGPMQEEYTQPYVPGAPQSYMPGQDISYRAETGGSYGDLRTPYTAIGEDGQQVQIDPVTGQTVETSIITTPVMLGGAAIIVLLGLYVMADKK